MKLLVFYHCLRRVHHYQQANRYREGYLIKTKHFNISVKPYLMRIPNTIAMQIQFVRYRSIYDKRL